MRRQFSIPRVLLLVETSRAYGRGILEGIARYAREHGPGSIRFEDRGLEPTPSNWLKGWRGDGIISRTVDQSLARALRATQLPIVELHGDRRMGTARVTCDDDAMGRLAVEHLLGCGLREFAAFSYGETWWTRSHCEGFIRALKARACSCHVYQPPSSIGERAVPVWHDRQLPRVIQWVRSLPKPIGIYTVGDMHAVRLLDACHEISVAVPEEVAILSVGNDPLICETVRPTLSSLDLDAPSVGYRAAELLDRMMAGKRVPEETIYTQPSHVVKRQSTDVIAVDDPDLVAAVTFIRQWACRGITVPRVANEIGLSRSVLDRRFRQYLGRTPKTEIMRVRIENAKRLLAKTSMDGQTVAKRSGFSSLGYFIKAFRRETGMTPRAYRSTQHGARNAGR